MASFDINEVARRVQSTSTGQDGPYTFNFQVNAASEIQVFRNDTLQTESTHYNTTLNADGTGSITFIDTSGSGGTDHSPTSGDVITIIGDQPLSRTTVFATGSVNQPATLETEFDNVVIRQQQLKEMMDRSIQLKASTRRTVTGTGTSGPLQFPYDDTASNNANKIIKFDSNGTALELGSTTANIDAVAGKLTEIGLLGTSDAVADMALLGTSAVVADMALLGNSDVIADMALLADSAVIADMAILATTDVVSDLNTLATSDIVSDINTLATSDIVSDLNTLATSDIVSDLNTLATSDIVSDINTLATSDVVSDLNTLATSDFVSDLNTLASSTVVSNIATVATNVAGVTSFAERYRVGSSDPSSDNDAGDLFFNTSSNTLKFFNGSSYNAITSGIADDEVTTAKIQDDAVTYAKIQNVSATDRILGRDSAGAGVIEEITPANLRTMINVADGANAYTHPNHSGEVTSTADGATVIANNAVTNAKMADDSVGSAELIDNSVGAAALNISGNGSSGQMIVSDADGSFSYADQPSGGGFSLASALSGTTPTINWSSATAFSHTLSGDTTYSFSNVPSGGEIELFLKNVGKTFSILNPIGSRVDVSFSGQITTSQGGRAGSFFNHTGSKFYLVDFTGEIHEYNCSTNHDISTVSHVQTKAGFSSATSGYGFNSDGTKLITIRGDDLHEHALSSAFDISTINTSAANSVNLDTVLGDSGGTGLNFNNGRFNSDGTKLFIANHRHSNSSSDAFSKSHFVISLSSAYDITSTLAETSSFDVGSDLVSFGGSGKDANVLSDISADGTNMIVVEATTNTSTDITKIHHYFLQAPFDLSTIKRVGTADISVADTSAFQISNARITADGKFYYINERNTSSTAENQKTRVYDIQADFKITFPSGTTTQPDTIGDGADPTTTSYLRLVSLDGSNILITDHREIA